MGTGPGSPGVATPLPSKQTCPATRFNFNTTVYTALPKDLGLILARSARTQLNIFIMMALPFFIQVHK